MANNINIVSISGNIVRDSEARANDVLTFSVANSEMRKQDDDWVNYPNYFDCVVFGKRAQALKKWLVKGTRVVISGRLHQSRYENKDGEKRSRVEIIVNDIEFTSPKEHPGEKSDEHCDSLR